jgi:hypothetical protein
MMVMLETPGYGIGPPAQKDKASATLDIDW